MSEVLESKTVGFTPGPLHVGKESGDGVFGILPDTGYSLGMALREEDARLWAAAPDLLEALKAMVDRWEPDCIGTDRRMYDDAVAAIAKATGTP